MLIFAGVQKYNKNLKLPSHNEFKKGSTDIP